MYLAWDVHRLLLVDNVNQHCHRLSVELQGLAVHTNNDKSVIPYAEGYRIPSSN